MHSPTLALLVLFMGSSIAAPAQSSSPYAVKERHTVPKGWTKTSRAVSSHTINLQIGLRQRNQDVLEQHLLEVSNPSHARYGQHLSAAEVRDLIAPSQETIDAVFAWLSEHDIAATLSPTRDWIQAVIVVHKIEELLNTTYSVFRHNDGSALIRAPEWSLPEHLHESIDVIEPTTSFFHPRRRATGIKLEPNAAMTWHDGDWSKATSNYSSATDTRCNVTALCNAPGTNWKDRPVTVTTLECLRCLYGTWNYTAQVPEKNRIAVTDYFNEAQRRTDIRLYLERYRPEAAQVADEFTIVPIANGRVEAAPLTSVDEGVIDMEADTNAELVLGISWPTSFMAWSTGGGDDVDDVDDLHTDEPFRSWLNHVLAQETLPQVISTSYGTDEQSVSYSQAQRLCDDFKQLGIRGTSVLFSSGDYGVSNRESFCYSTTEETEMFVPRFPASCPWVTTVGATRGFEPEVAVSDFASGAGFSNYFGMPDYQARAVKGYFDKIGDVHAGLYNRSGRGYPDVAAQGNYHMIFWNGTTNTDAGTSLATPVFAAVIALVNDALIAANKPPLGFLNQWIYSGAFTALTDIARGSSFGCGTDGFPAEVGWDAVTGFGTPNLDKLIAAAFDAHGR